MNLGCTPSTATRRQVVAFNPSSRRLSKKNETALLRRTFPLTNVSTSSVVAVHGLNFKGNPNHARATWHSQGSVWIRDFLPQRIGRPCRVMLFAYNSSPAKAAAPKLIDEHARMLLSCLKDKRKVFIIRVLRGGKLCPSSNAFQDSPLRPIVFLCHSLGGIVVKSVSTRS